MQIRLYKNATTTPALRQKTQESTLSERKLAQKYGVTRATVRRWKKRDFVHDAPIKPRNPHTSLNYEYEQEFVVLELRKTLLLSLDDLIVIVREFFKPDMTRSSLYRLLKRHNMHKLSDLILQEDNEKKTVKTFKDYEPGFVHIDVKYLPKMPYEDKRKYLFVAIDRATRWVYLEIKASKSDYNASSFLENLIQKAPFKISKILTDNGTEFTDRFQRPYKKPSGNYLFDTACHENDIEHRLTCPPVPRQYGEYKQFEQGIENNVFKRQSVEAIGSRRAKPYSPQTNWMVERFNGRINEVIKQTKFLSARSFV